MASSTKTVRFGPGAHESLWVRVWTARGSGGDRLKGEVFGSYRVYCGAGNEHAEEIREEFSGWRAERSGHEEADLLWRIREGDEEAAYGLADLAVQYALEDWTDPCEDEED